MLPTTAAYVAESARFQKKFVILVLAKNPKFPSEFGDTFPGGAFSGSSNEKCILVESTHFFFWFLYCSAYCSSCRPRLPFAAFASLVPCPDLHYMSPCSFSVLRTHSSPSSPTSGTSYCCRGAPGSIFCTLREIPLERERQALFSFAEPPPGKRAPG